MIDNVPTPPGKQPNPLRRKLTKTGLVAPVLLASLVSKPVLGAAPHNCTISGQISGNVSTHAQGDCTQLGKAPSHYASLATGQWPSNPLVNDWLTPLGRPRAFNQTPYSSMPINFADAFEKQKVSGSGNPSNPPFVAPFPSASVRDVLAGYVTVITGSAGALTQDSDWLLKVKSGYLADHALALELGREAIAAYMNAINITDGLSFPKYPVPPQDVVTMFNAVIAGGTYQAIAGADPWDAQDLLNYFKSLHP